MIVPESRRCFKKENEEYGNGKKTLLQCDGTRKTTMRPEKVFETFYFEQFFRVNNGKNTDSK